MPVLAHTGEPPAPHDLWIAWNLDPLLIAGLLVVVWLYVRGAAGAQRPRDRWRARAFVAALVSLGAALVSPLEALSGALASAHMVQHLLLVLVAAPLLAISAPSSRLLRGSPLPVRRGLPRWRRTLGVHPAALRSLMSAPVVWLAHVAVLWLWHAAAMYDAALTHPALHVAEHATFLVTGVLFWRIVAGGRVATRVSPGLSILLVFALGMQSVFLSLLLTFASTPFYAGYASTTAAWGLTPLEDQQLAGVIMWVPAGFVYVGAALLLLHLWLGDPDVEPTTPVPAAPGPQAGRLSGR